MRDALWLGCALCALAGVLLGVKLSSVLRAWRERSRGHAQRAQGLRGEQDAERLLRAHGYAIRARNATHAYEIEVDGARERVEVCLDFIVERNGEKLVAEVKTGALGPRVQRAETRRQLLEYQLATGTRRVLLVDPDRGRIREVAFPISGAEPFQPAASRIWRSGAIALLVVAAFVWWARSQS